VIVDCARRAPRDPVAAREGERLPEYRSGARPMITPLHSDSSNKVKVMPMRDTSAQDRPIDPPPAQRRRRYQLIGTGAGALLLLIVLVLVIRNWISAEVTVPIERVRIAEVTRG